MGSDISGIMRESAGAIRGFLGLTRHNRLREQIRDSIGLYALAKEQPGLEKVKDDLAKVAEVQADRLRQMVENPSPGRRWDWSKFTTGMVLVAVLGFVVWQLWPHLQTWWGLSLIAVIGAFGLIGLVINVQYLIERKPAGLSE